MPREQTDRALRLSRQRGALEIGREMIICGRSDWRNTLVFGNKAFYIWTSLNIPTVHVHPVTTSAYWALGKEKSVPVTPRKVPNKKTQCPFRPPNTKRQRHPLLKQPDK